MKIPINIDIFKFFPVTDKNGKKIIYGLRDCCREKGEGYGAHKTWCRYYK